MAVEILNKKGEPLFPAFPNTKSSVGPTVSNYWSTLTNKSSKSSPTVTSAPVAAPAASPAVPEIPTYINPTNLSNYTIDKLSQLFGVMTNKADFEKSYLQAADANNKALSAAQAQAEGTFYTNLNASQNAYLDTLRRSRAAAVQSGASAGVNAAQELSTLLGVSQQDSAAASQLAQARQQVGLQQGANTAQAYVDALTASESAKSGLANIASGLYTADQNYNAAAVNALQNYMAATYTANQNRTASDYAAQQNKVGVEYTADKNAAAQTAAQTAYPQWFSQAYPDLFAMSAIGNTLSQKDAKKVYDSISSQASQQTFIKNMGAKNLEEAVNKFAEQNNYGSFMKSMLMAAAKTK